MAEKQNDQKTEKPDSVGSQAELIGRIIQSEQKLSEYFTTIITKSVTEQIERRNMARLRLFGIVSVVVVSLMIPAIAAVFVPAVGHGGWLRARPCWWMKSFPNSLCASGY